MRQAVIVDAIRTPVGKHRGILRDIRPDDLAAYVIRTLLERAEVDPERVEDVYFGCANQAGEDNRNVARMAVLLAGLPYRVPGVTVNRLCGSGLQAINDAARAIQTSCGDIFIAGGVESMTRAPFVVPKDAYAFPRGDKSMYDTTLGWRFINPRMVEKYPPLQMGETAEIVAEQYGIGRAEQDRFALQSHRRAVAAARNDRFRDEIVPVEVPDGSGKSRRVRVDEGPRPDTSVRKLAQLPPAFKEGGTVTAGNSSGVNDGAAAVLLMEAETARKLGYEPIARVLTSAVVGVHPSCMGLGPIPATEKVLQRAGLSIKDLDLIELNEAFAAQVMACVRDLKLPTDRLNVNGGAIALGHPIGCSGARIMTTLVHEMKRRKAHYGLATMCIGVGQGIGTLVESVE